MAVIIVYRKDLGAAQAKAGGSWWPVFALLLVAAVVAVVIRLRGPRAARKLDL